MPLSRGRLGLPTGRTMYVRIANSTGPRYSGQAIMTIITESLTSIGYVPGAHSGLPAALPTKSESRHLQTSPSTPAREVLSVGFLDSNVPARGKLR